MGAREGWERCVGGWYRKGSGLSEDVVKEPSVGWGVREAREGEEVREALDPGVRRARGGLGGECEPQGWGEGFGPRRKERRSGTRVPGASASSGWHLEEPWTGGWGGGKSPNTLGWITVRPGLARLRVGRGSGGPSRKGGVDRDPPDGPCARGSVR